MNKSKEGKKEEQKEERAGSFNNSDIISHLALTLRVKPTLLSRHQPSLE
jgi:hypothetical protein